MGKPLVESIENGKKEEARSGLEAIFHVTETLAVTYLDFISCRPY